MAWVISCWTTQRLGWCRPEARGPRLRGLSSLCPYQMERPPSTSVKVILSGSLPPLWKGPKLMRRFGRNEASVFASTSILSFLLVTVRLHAMFCFCPSMPASLLSTHVFSFLIILAFAASAQSQNDVHTSRPLRSTLAAFTRLRVGV